jgi:hypothetical protein
MGYLTGDTKAPSTHIPAISTDCKQIKDDNRKALVVPNLEFEEWDAADQ